MDFKKRKHDTINEPSFKRYKSESQVARDELEQRLLQKLLEKRKQDRTIIKLQKTIQKLENENSNFQNNNNTLEDKIKRIENRILRIENFNQELREKNIKLEEELESRKEEEICKNLSHISFVNPYSYIN